METDIWGQLALEATSVYLGDGLVKRSPFEDTVYHNSIEKKTCFDYCTIRARKENCVMISYYFCVYCVIFRLRVEEIDFLFNQIIILNRIFWIFFVSDNR